MSPGLTIISKFFNINHKQTKMLFFPDPPSTLVVEISTQALALNSYSASQIVALYKSSLYLTTSSVDSLQVSLQIYFKVRIIRSHLDSIPPHDLPSPYSHDPQSFTLWSCWEHILNLPYIIWTWPISASLIYACSNEICISSLLDVINALLSIGIFSHHFNKTFDNKSLYHNDFKNYHPFKYL